MKIRFVDHYVFQWVKRELENHQPEDVVAFYVQNLIFKNGRYFEDITTRYHLPNDILKAHKKILRLAEMSFEGELE